MFYPRLLLLFPLLLLLLFTTGATSAPLPGTGCLSCPTLPQAPNLQARAGGTHVTETEMRRFARLVESGRIPEYAQEEYERLATMGINRLQEEQRLRAQLHAEGYTDLHSLPPLLRQQYLSAQNKATQASLDFSGHVQKWLGNA
ncbi:hypothetical protein CF328_g3218 [Tilletia controversa]|nr:hypothetical protein CF328_g3218 [Tilletia controversa]